MGKRRDRRKKEKRMQIGPEKSLMEDSAKECDFPPERGSILIGDGVVFKEFPKANLGYASTEDLFRELISRMSYPMYMKGVNTACMLSEMLGGLEAYEKEYRTAGSL